MKDDKAPDSILEKRRIHVTGNAGSGKTTLAWELASLLDLEMVQLDSVVWERGWRKTAPDKRKRLEREIASKPGWVVDGVSRTICQAADVVIFLDFPRSTSYLRSAKRNWRYLFKTRPGLPENCPEILILPALFKIIWQFPKRVRPRIIEDCLSFEKTRTFIHIKNNEELQEFLQKIYATKKTNQAQGELIEV